MLDILKILQVASAARQGTLTDADRERALEILEWQKETLAAAKAESDQTFKPTVQALADYLGCTTSSESIARMYATRMLEEIKLEWFVFHSINDWLCCINYVIQRAPEYGKETFPMSKLFVFFMYSESGAALFRLPQFNVLLTDILQAWCEYLDDLDSAKVLTTDGWLSPSAIDEYCLTQCDNYHKHHSEDYWGFTSFNDFFHRALYFDDPTLRPLAGEDDDSVIVSPNDGTVYRIASGVKLCDRFWAKGQNYSLLDMLGGSTDNPSPTDLDLINKFVGGDVLQSFLDGSDYHRWHAPISGKIIKAQVISGLTFSELRSEGLDLSAGTESQGYQAMVNTRGLIIIKNDQIGKVAMLPIGITEISSITINVQENDEVKKGDELGWFSYGGSSMALVFQSGMINSFTAQETDPSQPPPACKSTDNCLPESGCLRVKGQIATANYLP